MKYRPIRDCDYTNTNTHTHTYTLRVLSYAFKCKAEVNAYYTASQCMSPILNTPPCEDPNYTHNMVSPPSDTTVLIHQLHFYFVPNN
jgi:hypothetical protein